MRRVLALILAAVVAGAAASCGVLRDVAESLLTTGDETDLRERAGELIPHFEERYFLSALDDRRLGAVCDIYGAAMAFEGSCKLDGVSAEELKDVLDLLFAECPELFQLDRIGEITGMTSRRTGRFVSLDLAYSMDAAEYGESREKCEEIIAGFARDTAGLEDEAREKVVFDAIASTCRYVLDAPHAGSAVGALLDREAKCDGVSAAMKWAMEELGIPCVTLTADIVGGKVGHAWNAVELGGKWYRVDLTQSTRIDEFTQAGLEEVIYFAFNISDDFVTESYEVLDAFTSVRELPVCDSMERSWFARNDLYIRNGKERDRILDRLLLAVSGLGGGSFTVQFENADEYRRFPDELGRIVEDFYASRGLRCTSWSCRSLPYNVCVVTVEE